MQKKIHLKLRQQNDMKKLNLFLLIVLFSQFSIDVLGQTDSIARKGIEDILNQLKALDKTEEQNVGYIQVINIENQKYHLFDENDIFLKAVKIDSISLIITDGCIVDIKVFSEKQIYTNQLAPIGLTFNRFKNGKKDKLFSRANNYVVVQDILFLNLINNYIPKDGIALIKKGQDTYRLIRNVGINTIFDIRIYSDALGLIGGQSNAIAQTDLQLKQFLHRKNKFNRGAFPLQYFKLGVNVSKFDSKDKFVDSLTYSSSKLLQKSYANVEGSFNIINGWLAEKKASNIYYLDFGGGINLGRLSKHSDSLNTEIISRYLFIDGGINFRLSDNIGSTIYGRYIMNFTPFNEYAPINSKYTEFFNLGAEIFFSPLNDLSNKFFARANFTFSTATKEQKDAFLKLQIGYSISLSKLIEKK
jgi:hypothetical protein